MVPVSTVYQRTEAGRAEIHEKRNGLTQSERLVLIMVDGVSNFSEVKAKLPVLSEQRFERAMGRLLSIELIAEVLLPVVGQTADRVEPAVIDRYLQQDPLDPLTIILHPEDERLDLDLSPKGVQPAPINDVDGEARDAGGMGAQKTISESTVESGSDTVDMPSIASASTMAVAMTSEEAAWAEEIGAEARAKEKPAVSRVAGSVTRSPYRRRRNKWGENLPIMYWLAIVAGAFILGYALARFN